MAEDARTVVSTYYNAWMKNDFATMRSVLNDRMDFAGPIDKFDSADAFQETVRDLTQQIVTEVVVQKMFVDGADVLTWYDLHTKIAPPAPVAEWSHVEDGKITMVRAVFDARPFAPAAGPAG